MLGSAATPALALIVVAFFGGYALFGANGVLAGFEYRQMLDKRQAELALLQKERTEVANRVALLDPSGQIPIWWTSLSVANWGLRIPTK